METVYSTTTTQAPTATAQVNASEGDVIGPWTEFRQSRLIANDVYNISHAPKVTTVYLTTTTQVPIVSVE